jgi:hypothetical protein
MHNTTHAPLAVSGEEPHSGRIAGVTSASSASVLSLSQSGADALVRARPPGRALALIVNSYAGQDTSGWPPRSGKKIAPKTARPQKAHTGRKYSILECVS